MSLVVAVALLWLQHAQCSDFSDLQGPYCGTRSDGCCLGRLDHCSVPILGTLCYCDDFCNRTRSEDCCPDFWQVCLGIDPPAPSIKQCYHGGKFYPRGSEIKINCNKCTCQVVSDSTNFICERNTCLVEPELISKINLNTRELGWSATNYSFFWGRPLTDGISYRTGTLLPHKTVKRMMPVMKAHVPRMKRSFDARTKWPDLVSGPKDQGWCGASWAVSTVAVASDRFAVMSRGMEKVSLSAQHLLSCNNRGQRGCHGGHLSRAWMYVRKFGLVDDACYPWTGRADRCKLPKKANLLTARCAPLPSQRHIRTELYKVGPVYRLQGEQDIMADIMESGPVQATMKVYQDFFNYRSGVYRKSSFGEDKNFGYQSVKIVGWGEEPDIYGQPVKYWLAMNSWGQYWGEDGLFKIVRGQDECDIEQFVLAAWSKTEEPMKRGHYFPGNGRHNGNYLNNTISNRLRRKS